MIWRIDRFKINGVFEKTLIEGMFVRQVKTVKIYKHSVNNSLQHAATKKKKRKKRKKFRVQWVKITKIELFQLWFSYIFKSLFLNYRCKKFKCYIWREKESAGGERHLYSGWKLFLEQWTKCLCRTLTHFWPVAWIAHQRGS